MKEILFNLNTCILPVVWALLWRLSFYSPPVGAISGAIIIVHCINSSFLEKTLPIIIVIVAIYSVFNKMNNKKIAQAISI